MKQEPSALKWIEKGYENFAKHGIQGIKIEPLSKEVFLSKSSFYHFFGEQQLFLEHLMAYHLAQCEVIRNKEEKIDLINPDLIHILIEHKWDLLFNRQLRLHQTNNLYKSTLELSNQIMGSEFVRIFIVDTKIQLNPNQIQSLYSLALDQFFLNINEENIHFDWLNTYFDSFRQLAMSLQIK